MPTLVLADVFVPSLGGSIHWLLNTYSRYNAREVIVVAPRCHGDTMADKALPFRVYRVSKVMREWDPTVPMSFARYIEKLWYTSKICWKDHIEQIHCAKVFPEGVVAWCMQGLSAIPYLIYAHGEEIQISLTSRKLAWLLPKMYNSAAAIIANSRHTKSLLERIGVQSDKIYIIHPGVDPASFDVADEAIRTVRQRHNLGQSPVILTVGRMQRRKGHDMVIKALPSVVHRVPDVKYLIVGTGEEQTTLYKIAQDMGVLERVVFAGQVPAGELAAYYAACDVFVMPNRQIGPDIEGFGIVFVEASAAGKPVIGGDSGGTEDAILHGVTGWRVDGTNVEAIATAVTTLLTEPGLAKAMGSQGRYRVVTEFSWDRVVERTRMVAAQVQQSKSKEGTS
jgi:phosphatidylinositol alpha-1,6-mannosyltransferase